MGRQYYCDYCDKSFSHTPDAVKKHINGMQHRRLRDEHYALFEDPSATLERETKKRPCKSFQETGQCRFGSSCKFTHLGRYRLEALRSEVDKKKASKLARRFPASGESFESWMIDRKRRGLPFGRTLEAAFVEALAKNSARLDLSKAMSWNYPEFLDYRSDIPPSLKRLTVENFIKNNVANFAPENDSKCWENKQD